MDLFGTAGIRGTVVEEVTPTRAMQIGQAVGHDGEEFALGCDGRVTSPALTAAMEAGLESAGGTVVRIGQCPTPTLAYASRGRRGVMITASHNPPPDNGIKLFVDGSEYDRTSEQRIEQRVSSGDNATGWADWADSTRANPLAAYRQAVSDYGGDHGGDASGLTVAVDCGNGVASLATPQVLRSLGADVRALEASVDGYFPARQSKPTPESLTALRSFVADSEATFGIGHDGDADRIVIVDDNGEIVHEDTVLAILAEHYVHTAPAANPVVVTTPNASGRIDERVAAAGGTTERVRLGALHEGIDTADGTVVFAAEPWKHIHPAFGSWIDGVVSAAVLTTLVAKQGLPALREPITERPYRKRSVDCPDDCKAEAIERLESDLPERFSGADVSTEHGVRLTFSDDSWTLVRPSGTEPYIRVYAESDDVDQLADQVVGVVEDAIPAVE